MGQVGSHLVMVKTGVNVNLSIPQHKELSVGTLRALIRNSGLTVDEFLRLLFYLVPKRSLGTRDNWEIISSL